MSIKSKTDLDFVLKHLPSLTLHEVVQVRDRVNFLLGLSGEEKPKHAQEHDWLLEGILQELRRRGIWLRNQALPKRTFPLDYRTKAAAIRIHLQFGCKEEKLGAVQSRALGGLAGVVLLSYLEKIKVPLTPKTVLANIDKIPAALEESFPGYWANRLLSFISFTKRDVSP